MNDWKAEWETLQGQASQIERLIAERAHNILRKVVVTTATGHPRLIQAKRMFARIRMPLAKLKASEKYSEKDFNFPYPITKGPCIGWAVNERDIVLRDALSSEFLEALDEFCESLGVAAEIRGDRQES